MKVALILAELEDWKKADYKNTNAPPLGLAYLASYARKHAEIASLDIRVFRETQDLIDYRPDLVGISAFTSGFSKVDEIACRVKEELGIPIVVGGSHISALPTSLPPSCAIGVLGEGEITFREILEAHAANSLEPSTLARIPGVVYWDNGQLSLTEPRPLIKEIDHIPFPARELFGDQWTHPEKFEQLITSRGCPFSCVFCSVGATMGRRFRQHSVEYIVREIEHIRETIDPARIKVEDDLFTIDKKRIRDLATAVGEIGLNRGVVFNGNTRSNLIDEEWCEILKRLGFDILQMGLESMSDHLLRFLNKTGINAEVNARAVDLIFRQDIFLACSFILGIPGETRNDIAKLYNYIMDNMHKFVTVGVSKLRVYPGTELWKYAKAKGLCDEDHLDGVLLKDGEDTFLDNRPFVDSAYVYLNEENIPRSEFGMYCDMFEKFMDIMPPNWHRNVRLGQAERELERLRCENDKLSAEVRRYRSESWKSILKRKAKSRVSKILRRDRPSPTQNPADASELQSGGRKPRGGTESHLAKQRNSRST